MAAVELRCDHVSTTGRTVLSHPSTVSVPARRGTAAAATHRDCSRRTHPGLDSPPPRRAPWHRPTGRAAAWRRLLGTSGRGRSTRGSRGPGRLRPSGAAAGPPAARAPRAPAADPWGPEPCLAAGGSARPRHRTQPSRLGLEGVFFINQPRPSKTKLLEKHHKTSKNTSIHFANADVWLQFGCFECDDWNHVPALPSWTYRKLAWQWSMGEWQKQRFDQHSTACTGKEAKIDPSPTSSVKQVQKTTPRSLYSVSISWPSDTLWVPRSSFKQIPVLPQHMSLPRIPRS